MTTTTSSLTSSTLVLGFEARFDGATLAADEFVRPFHRLGIQPGEVGESIGDAVTFWRSALREAPGSGTYQDLLAHLSTHTPATYQGVLGGGSSVGAKLGEVVDGVLGTVPGLLAKYREVGSTAFAGWLASQLADTGQLTPDVALAMLVVTGLLAAASRAMDHAASLASAPQGGTIGGNIGQGPVAGQLEISDVPPDGGLRVDVRADVNEFILFAYSSSEFDGLLRHPDYRELSAIVPGSLESFEVRVSAFVEALFRRGMIDADLIKHFERDRSRLKPQLERLRRSIGGGSSKKGHRHPGTTVSG